MQVLVLGSSGVIGRATVQELRKVGHDVTEWDIALSPEHDLRVMSSLFFVLKKIDFVFFFAFDVGGSKYPTQSAQYISNNMRLLENTFDSLRTAGVPFVHTTSQMSNMDHVPYGPLKRIAEFYTEYLGGVNVKVWNVYGPEELGSKSHVITDFIHQAKTRGEIRMLTTGEEQRQFLHARDFARAMIHVMKHYETFKGQTVDISNYTWISIREVADMIGDMFHVPVIPGTLQSTFQTKVNEPSRDFLFTGWTSMVSLHEGILNMTENGFLP